MARGGSRPGSGRKSKSVELKLSAIMDNIGDSEAILRILYKNALNPKNALDRKLWLEYKYGKPKDNEGQPTEMIIRVQRRG